MCYNIIIIILIYLIEQEEQEEEEKDFTWERVFPTVKVSPITHVVHGVEVMMEIPPDLESLRNQEKHLPRYEHVPETPPPRKSHLDHERQRLCKKIEMAMHAAISSLDSGNPEHLAMALGYMRSAWEDIHQSRRQAFAGRQRTKLDSRPDDNRTRLLTKDEEKEVEKGRMSKQKQHWGKGKGRGKGSTGWNATHTWSEWKPRSSGKGKGKGKSGKEQQEK